MLKTETKNMLGEGLRCYQSVLAIYIVTVETECPDAEGKSVSYL